MSRRSRNNNGEGAAALILGMIILFSIFYFLVKSLDRVNTTGKVVGGTALLFLFYFIFNRLWAHESLNTLGIWYIWIAGFVVYGLAFAFHTRPDVTFDPAWVKEDEKKP